MVHLRHDVAWPFRLNLLESLVVIHLDPTGLMRKVEGQLELGAVDSRPTELAKPGPGLGARTDGGADRHQLAIPASRAISIVRSIDRLSSSSGRYDSSDVASSDRTSLTVRIVAAVTFAPAAFAREAR